MSTPGAPEIRLVLTDLDATMVVPDGQHASPVVLASIREAEERGVRFSAVTGRPYGMCRDLLCESGFTEPCAFQGGAVIIDPTNDEVRWSRKVPLDTSRAAAGILAAKASIIDVGLIRTDSPRDIDLAAITEPTYSVWALAHTDDVPDLVARLNLLPKVAIHLNNDGDPARTGIQVTHVEADKGHAVDALLELLGVDRQHTLAIANGDNDLPLFRAARLKIAVSNASERLKAAADHIVGTVYEDGFAQAMHQFAR